MSDKVQPSAPIESGALSSWSTSPLRHLMRLNILFLRELFSAAPKGYWHWEDDEEATEIIITKDVPVDEEVVMKRPVIAVVRSAVGWSGLGMDQMLHEDVKNGERTHVDMISGNLTYNCIARVPDEAEQIAWLVATHVWLLRRVLLKLGFHDIGQRCQVMAPTPPGALVQGAAKEETINVPAFTTFQFSWGAQVLEQDVPILKSVETNLTAAVQEAYSPTNIMMEGGWGTGLSQVDGRPVEFQNIKGRINPPSIKGRPAQVTEILSSQEGDPLSITVKT